MTHTPATARRIDPQTTAILRITVTDTDGDLVDIATCTADVYGPTGQVAATNQAVTFIGAGQYDLTILPAWSTALDGDSIEGEFRAFIAVAVGQILRTIRVPYRVSFIDT